jgi:hypothetical protein
VVPIRAPSISLRNHSALLSLDAELAYVVIHTVYELTCNSGLTQFNVFLLHGHRGGIENDSYIAYEIQSGYFFEISFRSGVSTSFFEQRLTKAEYEFIVASSYLATRTKERTLPSEKRSNTMKEG